jgi:predicted small lipoprotein YifL
MTFLASFFVIGFHQVVNLRRIEMKKLGIVALLLSLSACGSIGGYSLNPMDYLGGSSDAEAEASE